MCKHFVRWKGIFFLLVTTIPLTHFLCALKVGGTCGSLAVTFQGSWPWLSFCGCCWVPLLRSCVDRQTWVRQMPGSGQDQSLGAAFSLSLLGPVCSRTESPRITPTSTGNRKMPATLRVHLHSCLTQTSHSTGVLSAAVITAAQREPGEGAWEVRGGPHAACFHQNGLALLCCVLHTEEL